MNIVLTGFMASGKSSVGRILSEKTGRDFIDLDSTIEKWEGQKIKDIFGTKGEAWFRQRETDACRYAAGLDNCIISTGGGVILNPENMQLLKKNSIIVYLKVSAEGAVKRLSDASRPLLNVANPVDEAARILSSRVKLYEKYADITIDTEKHNLQQISGIILKKLRETGI